MNSTLSPLEASFTISDYYIACSLSSVISLIGVFVSISVSILVYRTKPRLHTVRHLLICNTCVASILYCIVQTINYIFLIFLRTETSDVGCRWRGYFAYLTIAAVTYSYLIQAISRFFISVLSSQYRWLTTFKTHYILIFLQWLTIVIIPLPSILTNDIYYRPTSLCWVPLKRFIHVIYSYSAYYIVPTSSVCIVYIFIFYRVKKFSHRPCAFARPTNKEKRDLELLRNITALLFIYLLGGIPSILFAITASKPIYLLSLVTMSLSVAIEKVSMIMLDRDIRQAIMKLLLSTKPALQVKPIKRHTCNQL
ncbi:unnamed protein product [Adineta ricciae]|uniref:G-protein coupled receptors family 1 profile domain-containing protein n=1 Tax=Adineta ricciae TaxID=249248 RepID=A0A814RX96_ADIRI|nr:unnamed protein product [Adineta ricciae]CAF1139170.1 unnamed protein product [Adineta ricciae]